MEYSFTNVWGQSWGMYKKSWLMLTAGVVIFLFANIPSQISNLAQNGLIFGQQKNPDQPAWSAISGGIGCFILIYSIFVLLPLLAGLIWMGLRAARGQTPMIGDILRGYRRFPTVLGTCVLVYILILIPLILALAVGAAIIFFGVGFEVFKDSVQQQNFDSYSKAALLGAGAWVFICFIVMYWIGLRTSFALLVAVDESISARGPLACIEMSWKMTRGRALSLLGLFITIGVMMLATLFACCLPVIGLGYPLALTMYGLAYNMLLNRDGFTDQYNNQFANPPTDAPS
jgi:uncharacterized membrane protein